MKQKISGAVRRKYSVVFEVRLNRTLPERITISRHWSRKRAHAKCAQMQRNIDIQQPEGRGSAYFIVREAA